MKALSHRIIAILGKHFPGSIPINNTLLFKLPNHFVHGVLLEKTPYTRSYYIWEIFVPLMNPMKSVTLNYSHRLSPFLSNKKLLIIDAEGVDTAAETIASSFRQQVIFNIEKDFEISDFLDLFPFDPAITRPNIILDYAIANCLLGQIAVGEKMLKSLEVMASSDFFIKSIAKNASNYVIALTDQGEKGLVSMVFSNEIENLKLHFPKVLGPFLSKKIDLL